MFGEAAQSLISQKAQSKNNERQNMMLQDRDMVAQDNARAAQV